MSIQKLQIEYGENATYINIGIHFLWISLCKQNWKHIACKIALHEYNPNPQKYVPSLHLKSQLQLRPSVKFQMHILATSDKRLPMHVVEQWGLNWIMLQSIVQLCTEQHCNSWLARYAVQYFCHFW